jgi:TonB family protein
LYRAREFVKSCIQLRGRIAPLRNQTPETPLTVHPKFRGEAANLPVAGDGTPARQSRGLIALTHDAALIKALQDLAGGGIDVSVVADLRSMTDELLQHAGATALIDTAALDAPVEGVVDAITRQLPDLRLMVAGHGADQQQLASRISNQTVFRFVHKPASPQRLKLFLDAAARTGGSASVTVMPGVAGSLDPGARQGARGQPPRVLAGIGMAIIAAIAVAAWLFWPKPDSAGTGKDPQVAGTSQAKANPQVAALLGQAELAFKAERFVASDGSSAAELYRAAQKLNPASKVAADGYDRAIDQGLRNAEKSLLAGRLNDAGNIAEAVRLLAPDNARLEFLNAQISRELTRVNADASQRQAFETRQAQIRAALVVMKDKLQRGALLDPATSSAVSSFREAEAIGAGDPAVRSARDTLVAALLTAADADLGARRTAAAKRLVDAAGSINSNAPGLDVLRRRVDEVTTQLAAAAAEAAAAAAAARIEAPAPVAAAPPEPAPVVASAPPATVANEVVSARTLRLLRSENPVYPERALDKLISGWVEMEFTVAKDGSVKDITVTNAEPKNTFNAAATAALARYRYAPVVKDGAAVTQRAQLRMRFTAQDAK